MHLLRAQSSECANTDYRLLCKAIDNVGHELGLSSVSRCLTLLFPFSCIHKMHQASGSQRAGRAGRVRPGKCWRLYPQAFHDINMPTHTLAEMLRTPLEELVLQVSPIACGEERRGGRGVLRTDCALTRVFFLVGSLPCVVSNRGIHAA